MGISVQTEVDLTLKLHAVEEAVYEPPMKLTVEVQSRDGSLTKTGIFVTPQELLDSITEGISDLQNTYIEDAKGLAYVPHTLEIIIIRIWERIQEALPYQVKLTSLTLRKDAVFVVKYTTDDFSRQTQLDTQIQTRKK